MKKIRVLLLLLVILMIPCLIFISCNKDDDDGDKCAEGHTWRNASNPKRQKLIQNRTCILPEIRERECKVCGHKEEYISDEPTGHRYDSSKKIYLNDATCTTNGHTVNHCYWYERCGYEADLIEEVPGSATGHTFLYYAPSPEDPSIGIAKCTDCDATDTILLGIKLDMEGDRSHLSYQAMQIYTANAANAYEYKTVGENTYLQITRPASGYLGGTEFGVVVSPATQSIKGKTYIVEATLILDKVASGDIKITANKAQLSQSMNFITYNSTDKTIEGLQGAVYGLDDDDFANGVKIALLVNDTLGWYQIYVNNTLVSDAIAYVGDYFAGIELANIEIVATGRDATVFGLDNIRVYAGSEPDGYEDAVDKSYVTVTIESTGEKLNIKSPVTGCTHAYATKKTVTATCTTAGYTLEECSVCKGQRIVSEVEPTGHDLDEGVESAPTCFEPGYTVYTCKICGERTGEQSAPKLEHVLGDDAVRTPESCKSNAFLTGDCTLCGTNITVELLGTKLTHALGDNYVVTEPTCDKDGYTSGPCKHCGENYIDESTKVTAFGHYYFELDKHVEATCTTIGYDEYTCLSCGKQFRINEKSTTGHKLFTKTETKAGVTTVTQGCINCDYSYSYTAAGETLPKYSEVDATLGVGGLKFHYYEDDANSRGRLLNDGGDYTKDDKGMFKNGQWQNGPDNEFGRFISNPTGSDAYINFPASDQNLTANTVWEFDIRYPAAGVGDEKNPQYGDGGFVASFSTDGADGAGFAPLKVYPDGSIVMNNLQGSFNDYNKFGSFNYTGEGSKTKGADIELAPAGTVNSDTWVRIGIVLNTEYQTYTVYVNGVPSQTISYAHITNAANSQVAKVFRYIRFMITHVSTGVTAVEFRNMYYYNGDKPVYMVAPAENTDALGTSFLVDDNTADTNGYLADLAGDLSIAVKQNFKASVGSNRLTLKYDPVNVVSMDGALDGTDSHLYGAMPANSTYTVNSEVTFNATTGNYDIVKLYREAAELSLVYIKDGKICIYGTDWTQSLTAGFKAKVDVVVRDGTAGNTFDAYINGILVVEGVSYADTDYGRATATGAFKMFNVIDAASVMDVIITQLNVFDKEVVPNYYEGRLASYTAPGYTDYAVKFDGTENVLGILPANTPVPNGYYYEEIVGESYLSLAVAPATQKVLAGFKYVQVGGNGTVGATEGFWTLGAGEFKTNGVYPISLMFDGIPADPEKGYDISAYSTVTVRFYVNDKTSGYKFAVMLPGEGGMFTVLEGVYETGWHVVTVDLTDAPDYVFGAIVYFMGIDDDAEIDGFNFYLESIYFTADGFEIEESDYILKPAKKAACEASATGHTYGDAVTVEAECDKAGYSYRVCSVCSYMELTVTERTGHTYEQAYTDGEEPEAIVMLPNCEESGMALYVCDCGKTTVKKLDHTGHNFVKVENATEADGYLAATCTTDGVDIYRCTNANCVHAGKNFRLTTSAIGHAKAEGATETVITELDCETDGVVRVSECANCGEAYDVITEMTGHDYKEAIDAATCLENGRKYEKCANCGDERNEVVLEATGHTVPAKYLHVFVPETCTNPAGWTYECLVCGCEGLIPDDEDGLPHPHTWGEWTTVTEQNCGNNGHQDKTCSECKGLISVLGTPDEKAACVIPATGEHTWNAEWSYSEDYVAGVRGEKWHDCDVCDEIKDLNGAGTEGLIFAYNNKNAYVITGYEGSDVDVVIPAVFKGMPVIIGNAFAGNTVIESVTIADGVLLSNGVFKGCTALESVKLPADLAAIPNDAFYGCTSLVSIELPASCTEIRSGAFYDCIALESIVINGTLTEVQMFAFAGCTALESVEYVTKNIPYIVIAEMGNDAFLAAKWTAIA